VARVWEAGVGPFAEWGFVWAVWMEGGAGRLARGGLLVDGAGWEVGGCAWGTAVAGVEHR